MKFSSKVEKCGQSPMRKFHPYAVAAKARAETIAAQEHTPHEADSMQTVPNEPKDQFRRNPRKFALAVGIGVGIVLFAVIMIALFVF